MSVRPLSVKEPDTMDQPDGGLRAGDVHRAKLKTSAAVASSVTAPSGIPPTVHLGSSDSCASAASGQVSVMPPSVVMNSRRFMSVPLSTLVTDNEWPHKAADSLKPELKVRTSDLEHCEVV